MCDARDSTMSHTLFIIVLALRFSPPPNAYRYMSILVSGAAGGTHVCLRYVRADDILSAIGKHGVTHLCGAPGESQPPSLLSTLRSALKRG